MTPTDLQRLREIADGFRGRFFYDYERGDIAYIATECEGDPRGCECPVKLTVDGEQDCSDSIGEVDENVGAPIADALNALPALLSEVEALRKHVKHNDDEYLTMKDVLRAEHEACKRLREKLKEACDLAESHLNARYRTGDYDSFSEHNPYDDIASLRKEAE